MKVAIVGIGKMGLPLAWAINKLGHDIHIVEPNTHSLATAEDILLREAGLNLTSSPNLDNLKLDAGKVDLIVSAAPYKYNYDIARYAIDRDIHYCDLGGHPETTKQIHRYRLLKPSSKSTVFCDLGLAPGWVNILAEFILQEKNVDSLQIRCGGIPETPKGLIAHAIAFNIEGLLVEYDAQGQAPQLENGIIVNKQPLTEVEFMQEKGIECFYTVGGLNLSFLQSLQERGVKNCSYKTIRHIGHSDIVKFLRDECFPGDPESFKKALVNSCPTNQKGVVVVSVLGYNEGKEEQPYVYQFYTGDTADWTAMQQCTAFPAASVIDIILKNNPNKPILNYSDVKRDDFVASLEKVNILLLNW